jgi:hypothetical protein
MKGEDSQYILQQIAAANGMIIIVPVFFISVHTAQISCVIVNSDAKI